MRPGITWAYFLFNCGVHHLQGALMLYTVNFSTNNYRLSKFLHRNLRLSYSCLVMLCFVGFFSYKIIHLCVCVCVRVRLGEDWRSNTIKDVHDPKEIGLHLSNFVNWSTRNNQHNWEDLHGVQLNNQYRDTSYSHNKIMGCVIFNLVLPMFCGRFVLLQHKFHCIW